MSRRRALLVISVAGGTLGVAGSAFGIGAIWALLVLATLLAGLAEIGSG